MEALQHTFFVFGSRELAVALKTVYCYEFEGLHLYDVEMIRFERTAPTFHPIKPSIDGHLTESDECNQEKSACKSDWPRRCQISGLKERKECQHEKANGHCSKQSKQDVCAVRRSKVGKSVRPRNAHLVRGIDK